MDREGDSVTVFNELSDVGARFVIRCNHNRIRNLNKPSPISLLPDVTHAQCCTERRQLESCRALLNALAVFSVIAWRLLLLRHTARTAPDAPANAVLTSQQIRVLSRLCTMKGANVPKVDLPANPSAEDALRAVAQLGGHLRSNGPPGWQVLGRGYDTLLLVELGWMARGATM